MKHRKETQEYNSDIFKHTDTDNNGYLEWEEYVKMVRERELYYIPCVYTLLLFLQRFSMECKCYYDFCFICNLSYLTLLNKLSKHLLLAVLQF